MSGARKAAGVHHIGRYTLHGEIASGGMASVHFGKLTSKGGFERAVAVKRLHPHLVRNPEFRAVILDEARLAARVRHPNVVQPLDVIDGDGEVLLVMEYVHGESLSRLIRRARERNEPVPLPICAAIMAGVLHGLHAAHEAKDDRGNPLGIVHRDVSPQNVIVGTDGVARVIDFGIAKARTSAESTQEGQVKGKVPYLAPEQIAAEPATKRTDIYAASVMFWELVVGRRLFTADQDQIIIALIAQGNVEPPSSFVEGVPIALDDLIMRGIARDPEDRFSSAREMALLLESILPLATPSAVGDWVEELAKESLKKRAAQLSDVERLPPGPDTLRALEQDAAPRSTPSLQSLPSISPSSSPPPGQSSTVPPKSRSLPVAPVRLPKAGELQKPAVQIPNVEWRPSVSAEDAQRALSSESIAPKARSGGTLIFVAIVLLAIAAFIYALPLLVVRSYVKSASLQGVTLSIERADVSMHEVRFHNVSATIADLPAIEFRAKQIEVGLKEFAPEVVVLQDPELTITGEYSALRIEFTKWAATHRQTLSLPESLRDLRSDSTHVVWKNAFGPGSELSSEVGAFAVTKEPEGALGDTFHSEFQLLRARVNGSVFGPYRLVVDGFVDRVTSTLRLNPGKATDASIRFVHSADGAHSLQSSFSRVPLTELGLPIAPILANVDFDLDASVVVVQPNPGDRPPVVRRPVTGKISILVGSDTASGRARATLSGDLGTAIVFKDAQISAGQSFNVGGSATFTEDGFKMDLIAPNRCSSRIFSLDSRDLAHAALSLAIPANCFPPR